MIFDLSILGRCLAIFDQYRAHPMEWAGQLCAASRPVLAVCNYDGDDVSTLFAGLDAIDRAIAQTSQSSPAVKMALADAREHEAFALAGKVAHILTTAMRLAEQAHDEEAAKNGATTTLEQKLADSTTKPRIALLPRGA